MGDVSITETLTLGCASLRFTYQWFTNQSLSRRPFSRLWMAFVFS